jgi:beta-glucosidase
MAFTARLGMTVLLLLVSGVAAPIQPAQSVEAGPSRCGDPDRRPWCDRSLSANERAGLLLRELTLDEEISLLAGDELTGVSGREGTHTGTSNGIERVGLPPVYFSDGPVGPRQGKATGMPSPMSVAASFSGRVAWRHARVVGDEVKRKGNDVVYAPATNLMRTPLNGRTFEYFGEDPYLSGLMAAGWTRGVQSRGVIGNVKHYAVNNQEGRGASAPGAPVGVGVVGSRFTVDARVGERALREMYLPAFEAAVKKGHVGSVMCAYPRVNGSYACENEHLLNDILKGDWGFDGFVLTDYGAGKNSVNSLNNGLDLDIWPGMVYSPPAVRAALAASQVSESTIHEHVRRILRTMFAHGFFDRPAFVDDTDSIDQAAHNAAAARIEAQGIVLMKNAGDLLPLDADRLRTLAVIGPEADVLKDGGGSSAIDEFRTTTPVEALRRRLGADRVVYDDGSDPARAAQVARTADAAVVVVGDKMTEGTDKSAPTLDADQNDGIDRDALIATVADAQPRTVAVLQSGGPVLTPWRSKVPSIVETWYPGQNGGTALARVLFGDVDPGGRLPATFPRRAEDLPTAGDPEAYPGVAETVRYKEGVLVGYRHYDENRIKPAFPFGHGLSYTTFRYGDAELRRGSEADPVATVSFTVTNTGDRTGYAVPQLYIGMPQPRPGLVQPPKQLKGVAKLRLAAGESQRVTLPLDRRSVGLSGDPAAAAGAAGGTGPAGPARPGAARRRESPRPAELRRPASAGRRTRSCPGRRSWSAAGHPAAPSPGRWPRPPRRSR